MTDFYRHCPVLILGGMGFIGSNLAARLVDSQADITLVDCLLPEHGGNPRNIDHIRDRVRVVSADIRDQSTLERLVVKQKLIFSLAAQTSHLGSMRDPMTDNDINCRAQLSLMECCRQHNPAAKIVFTSTRQVYGRPRSLPVDEHTRVNPVDVNGISKRAAEMYYALYFQVHQLRSVTLRLTNTYGPRMNLHGAGGGFLGAFIQRALTNSPIEVFGTGKQRRDFNYIDDVVDALMRAGSSDHVDGKVFNLGHPEHHSLLDVVHVLQHLTGVTYHIVPFPADQAAIDIGDFYSDCSQFCELTGWMPRFNLASGLARTLSFFRPQPANGHKETADGARIRRAPRLFAIEAGN